MEKILEKILEGQNKLFLEISTLQEGQQQLFSEVSGLKEGQQQLFSKVSSLEEGQQQLFSKVSDLEEGQQRLSNEVSNIREEMATKDDINQLETKIDKFALEGQDDVKAMLKRMNDKTDSLPRIEMKLDILEHRLFEQEVDIKLLKVVK